MIKIGDIRHLVLLLAGFYAVCPATVKAQARDTLTSFSLANQITLNEPVILYVTLENASADIVKVDLGANRVGAFRLAVTNPKGERLQLKPFSRPTEGMVLVGPIELQAGQSYVGRILLNRWFDFSGLGDYFVEAQLENPSDSGHRRATGQRKFHARLRVVARDPEQLRATCEILGQEVISSTSVEEALDAAVALSYVNDSVAVPFLQQILESGKTVELSAIQGLRNVGNAEAVRVLIAATKLKRDGGEIAEMARSALLSLKAETSNPGIRQQIELALKEDR